MKREWKPGDVAMTRYGRAFYSGDETRGVWTFDDGSGGFGPNFKPLQVDEPAGTRPLVVIDPEDAAAVERLVGLFFAQFPAAIKSVPAMRAALRQFADPKPPKPEEPTGLGAVVRVPSKRGPDFGVKLLVRGHATDQPWMGDGLKQNWSEIEGTIEVLSEGVIA